MSHEESFFFASQLILLMLLCLHYRFRPQLYAALLVLPFVLVSLVANQRRADYIALLVGMVVAWALMFKVRPRARGWLAVGMIFFVVLGASYVALFSNSTGSFAQPASAIVSVISPNPADTRDIASNLYRDIENGDLEYTAKQNPLLGLGFGKPFLQPVPLPNILALDPYYNYIPHNTIYWVWMRLGLIGYLALWYLFGAIIVRGCLLARQLRDRYLQLVAIYVVAVAFMEIFVAYADYQLYFYRNVIYLGLLAGILMKLSTLDTKEENLIYEATDGNVKPAISKMGSGHKELLLTKSTRR
jgi:hypothetical protein